MKGLLQQCGFEALVITDETKCPILPSAKNILGALKQIIDGSQAGDHIVFYFSGHVGRLLDKEDDRFHEAVGFFSSFLSYFRHVQCLPSLSSPSLS